MFLTKRQVIATIRQIKTSKDKFFKRLKELGFNSYNEYLRSDYWVQIKKNIRKTKIPYKCAGCGKDKSLSLHHRKYKAKMLDNVNYFNHLVWLCNDCHSSVHTVQSMYCVGMKQATKLAIRRINKNVCITNT